MNRKQTIGSDSVWAQTVALLSGKSVEGCTIPSPHPPKKHKSDVKILGATVQNLVVMATLNLEFVHSWTSICVTNRQLVTNFKPTVYDQIRGAQ